METPLTRRGSNNSVGLCLPPTSSSPIKVIGYAANLHGDGVLWEEQEEGPDEMTLPGNFFLKAHCYNILES